MVLRYSCDHLLSICQSGRHISAVCFEVHTSNFFLCITIHRSENGIAKIVLDFLKRSTFLIVGAVAVLK